VGGVGKMYLDPVNLPDVNPGPLLAPIDVWHAERSLFYAPISKVPETGVFWQTDDYIVPPKLGEILDFRKDRHQMASHGPDMLFDYR